MKPTIPTLETERLRLRPFALGDADAVRQLAGAAEVAASTLDIPHPYPQGAAEAWIIGHTAAAANGTAYNWALVRKADEGVLGAITLTVTTTQRRASLGYWLGMPFWNQGYTTEAARRVVAFGFVELGLHRVEAVCFPRNIASSRVMQKAGMTFEGVSRSCARNGDTFEDLAIYAILESEQAH
jgi:RimJ/RimL family protein N-acetyltransferase